MSKTEKNAAELHETWIAFIRAELEHMEARNNQISDLIALSEKEGIEPNFRAWLLHRADTILNEVEPLENAVDKLPELYQDVLCATFIRNKQLDVENYARCMERHGMSIYTLREIRDKALEELAVILCAG